MDSAVLYDTGLYDGGIYDAAVIGGGPAGCSAAMTLASRGVRVALYEAQAYPHDKLCGEFLSPECAGVLAELGALPVLQALEPVPIRMASLTAPDGTAWEAHLPGTAWGLTRRALDAALAARARMVGAEVRMGTSVTAISGDLTSGFELRLQLPGGRTSRARARCVLATHGKRAALDRALGRRFLSQPQPFVALKRHFYGPPLPGRIELHGFPGGYCGLSEIEGEGTVAGRPANVCLLVNEAVFRAAGSGSQRVPAFLEWMRRQNPRLDAWLAYAVPQDERWLSVAQVPFTPKRPVVNDVLMAGDAAQLIAPLVGDGIAMALRGGQLAAGYCAGFLAGQLSARALPARYAAAWRREFGFRLALARALQAVMLRPAWLAHGLRLLRALPPLGRFVLVRTRGAASVSLAPPAAAGPIPEGDAS